MRETNPGRKKKTTRARWLVVKQYSHSKDEKDKLKGK